MIADLRIQAATELAQQAFWAELVRHFPEITTGDFPPLALFAFNDACLSAVQTWVSYNSPDEDEEG